MSKTKHLDLGCGDKPRNPYGQGELFGLDQHSSFSNANIRACQLGLAPFPFESNFFDSVSAFDFLEHIPRQMFDYASRQIHFPFIELMDEIWRVLKPEGRFLALTPVYPAPQAFQDPTHVNIITDMTHTYFCGLEPHAARYGFKGRFEAIEVKTVLLEEVYEKNLSARLRWRKFKRTHFKGSLSHLIWEFVAKK